MANRSMDEVRSPTIGLVPLAFSFAPNGSSAVVQSSIKGLNHVSSVTRTGVGVFDIVLKDPWYDVFSFVPSLMLATDADSAVSSWTYTAATKTLTIRVRTAGVAADIAAAATNRIGGCFFVKNSSVGL